MTEEQQTEEKTGLDRYGEYLGAIVLTVFAGILAAGGIWVIYFILANLPVIR